MRQDKYEVRVREWDDGQRHGQHDSEYTEKTHSLAQVLDLMHEHIGSQSCIIWVKKNGRTVWKVKDHA